MTLLWSPGLLGSWAPPNLRYLHPCGPAPPRGSGLFLGRAGTRPGPRLLPPAGLVWGEERGLGPGTLPRWCSLRSPAEGQAGAGRAQPAGGGGGVPRPRRRRVLSALLAPLDLAPVAWGPRRRQHVTWSLPGPQQGARPGAGVRPAGASLAEAARRAIKWAAPRRAKVAGRGSARASAAAQRVLTGGGAGPSRGPRWGFGAFGPCCCCRCRPRPRPRVRGGRGSGAGRRAGAGRR